MPGSWGFRRPSLVLDRFKANDGCFPVDLIGTGGGYGLITINDFLHKTRQDDGLENRCLERNFIGWAD